MLRYKADLVSIVYIIIITTLLVFQWQLPEFNLFLYSATIFMTPTVFVMAHNHNHLSMWKSKPLNVLTDLWLIAFYGYPVFVWAPTHNLNHHKYTNREGDDTITYRFNNLNNLFTVLTYPFVSGFYQSKPIQDYLKKHWNTNRKRFSYFIFQYVFLFSYLLSVCLLDLEKALLYVIIPQVLCLFLVLIINYIQHVHADEKSRYNHSRNFVGIENKFMLNNGLHTAHHEKMSTHWSKLQEVHDSLEDKIDSRLIEKSLIWYLLRTYIFSMFIPRLRSENLRSYS